MLTMLADLNYFQILIWPGGGPIGMLLWVLSIVMVAVIVQNFIIIRRENFLPDGTAQQLRESLEGKKYREVIEMTSSSTDALSGMIRAALLQAPFGFSAMERALDEATEETTAKMLRHTEWLNLLGNVGPMVGLLGTVWGLILTFFKIVEAGGIPDPGKLAGAIGIKLVCTLLGLCIAIPSLAVYGVMRNRLDTLMSETAGIGAEMISGFRRAPKKAE